MTTVAAGPSARRPVARSSTALAPALAVAASASVGAGAIHASAVGAHSEHHQAVIAFTIVAAIQLAWGFLALVRPSRQLAAAGVVANAAFLAGWVLAKTDGISFVDGLDVPEGAQFADTAAAVLAAAAVLGALWFAVRGNRPTSLAQSALGMSALVTALITVPAMVAAGSHSHAHGHADGAVTTDGHDHSHATGGSGGPGHTHAAALPAKRYDPKQPIDLSGVPGVTPEQQARAENLIAVTLLRLPEYADPKVAEAAGYVSIGDGLTGTEHLVNVAYFDDGRILDPDYPESLVYDVDRATGARTLAAAMYMLAPDQTLDDVPDVGGKLTQWHIHDNLCFTSAGKVAGLTDGSGNCRPGLNKGSQAPMLHVWIRPHECGPFAALEGVGGGQIKAGETKLCDHVHGSA
jgi:hypothetical protein